jgi:phosphoribosyl-AMP cyclohydrolase
MTQKTRKLIDKKTQQRTTSRRFNRADGTVEGIVKDEQDQDVNETAENNEESLEEEEEAGRG